MSPHSVFELLRIVEIQRVTSRVYMGLGPIIPLFWPASGAMGAARGSWRFAPGVVAPPREVACRVRGRCTFATRDGGTWSQSLAVGFEP